MSCPFLREDAAYLLGALDPNERQRYESHLVDCPTCAQAVSCSAGIPGLMARLTPNQVAAAEGETEEPPPVLLDSLLRAARRERRVSRWRLATAAGAVAACLGVLGTGFALHEAAPSAPPGVSLHAVGGVPVSAVASLSAKPWGTQIQMRCEYRGEHADPSAQYVLVVRDREGDTYQLGTWRILAGRASEVEGSTSLSRDQIAAVEVQTTSGLTVAHANV